MKPRRVSPVDVEQARPTGELKRLTDDTALEIYPTLSWDGAMLAFTRHHQRSLVVRDLSTGKETVLLTSPEAIYGPRFSGDGRWITFSDLTPRISMSRSTALLTTAWSTY